MLGCAMPVIDTHCHASLIWYEPVETLLFEMDRNGVDFAVLIQMQGQTDNSYQEECVRRFPDRLASVVIVDTSKPDAPDQLRRLAERGASGIRLRADVRSPGDDPLAIWREAERLGLPVSCAGTSAEFASTEFGEIPRVLPGLKIIAEHLASANRPDNEAAERQQRLAAFQSLGGNPNVFMKVHGLGEFAPRAMPPAAFPFVQPIQPYLQQVYELFGPERMMWGSDFPPVASREGYANALRFCREQFADKPSEGRAQIFGATAAHVFRVPLSS